MKSLDIQIGSHCGDNGINKFVGCDEIGTVDTFYILVLAREKGEDYNQRAAAGKEMVILI